MSHFANVLQYFAIFSIVSCGRIDVQPIVGLKETTEKSHIGILMENIVPSVDEDHIKVLITDHGTVYDSNVKGKPEMFRKIHHKVHNVNEIEFNENESTTSLRPESTSHSNVYERTAQTKTTVHKTKKEKTTTTTTEMPKIVHLARAKRSFTKNELQSFSEMAQVFSESLKKFNDDASKAQKDFMGFMKKLDEMSAAHDNHF